LESQQASFLAAERSIKAAAEADAAMLCKDYERRLGELESQLAQAKVCALEVLTGCSMFLAAS
jgi:hypothetical protein